MQSSPLLNLSEKDRIRVIYDRIKQITDVGDAILISNFLELCHIKWVELVDTGGILSLISVPEVRSSWDQVWNRLEPALPESNVDHKAEALRNYLFFTASLASTITDPIQRINLPNSPPLKQLSEWTVEIDACLYQRYERQCGFLFSKLKRELATSTNESKAEATKFLEDLAPNVYVGEGKFQFHIKQKLYKVPHALDIKAKFYFNQTYGNESSIMLLKDLLADQDLKREIYNILDACSTVTMNDGAFELLHELIVKKSMPSILDFTHRGANLLSCQLGASVPLRTKLLCTEKK